MTGYKKEILGDRIGTFPKDLLCVLCGLILRMAVQRECGHRCCEKCLKKKFDDSDGTEELRCPACPMESLEGILDENENYPDFYARKELKPMTVKCCSEGCPWKGNFEQYTKHEPLCDLEPITCSKPGCSKSMRRGDLNYHMEKDCPMRTVTCRHCSDELPHMHMKEQNQCEPGCDKLVWCHHCSDRLLNKHMKRHLGVCPKVKVTCQLCLQEVSRGALPLHQDNETGNCPSLRRKQDNPVSTESVQRFQDLIAPSRPAVAESLEQTATLRPADAANVEQQELDRIKTLYEWNDTLQDLVAVLNNELEVYAEKVNDMERQNIQLQDTVEQQERQLHAHEQMLTVVNVALAEQELRIQSLESASYNGILVWKISDFARRRRDAVSGKTTSFYSPSFYTGYHGYNMCARIYLNGDGMGMGKGTHLSLLFIVMKGPNDNILDWPFRKKVTLKLFDQGHREQHVVNAFRPDPTSSSFKKPTNEMNIASGCPLFISLSELDNSNFAFVKDDCLFVMVEVDVSDVENI